MLGNSVAPQQVEDSRSQEENSPLILPTPPSHDDILSPLPQPSHVEEPSLILAPPPGSNEEATPLILPPPPLEVSGEKISLQSGGKSGSSAPTPLQLDSFLDSIDPHGDPVDLGSLPWTPRTTAASGPPSHPPPPPLEYNADTQLSLSEIAAVKPPLHPPPPPAFLGANDFIPPPPGDPSDADDWMPPPPPPGTPPRIPESNETRGADHQIEEFHKPFVSKQRPAQPPPASISTLPDDRFVQKSDQDSDSILSGVRPPSFSPPDLESVDSDGSWRKYVRPPPGPPPPLHAQHSNNYGVSTKQHDPQFQRSDKELGSQVDQILRRRNKRRGVNTLLMKRGIPERPRPPPLPSIRSMAFSTRGLKSPLLRSETPASTPSSTTFRLETKTVETQTALPGATLERLLEKQEDTAKAENAKHAGSEDVELDELQQENASMNGQERDRERSSLVRQAQQKWHMFSERGRASSILENGSQCHSSDKLRPGNFKRQSVKLFGDSSALCESAGVDRAIRAILAPLFRGVFGRVWNNTDDAGDRWDTVHFWVNHDCSKLCWSRAGAVKRPVSTFLNTSFIELSSIIDVAPSIRPLPDGGGSESEDKDTDLVLREIMIVCTDYGLQFGKKPSDQDLLTTRISLSSSVDFDHMIYGLCLTWNLSRLRHP